MFFVQSKVMLTRFNCNYSDCSLMLDISQSEKTMKKSGVSFGDDKQLGVDNPFSGDNGFGQGLPKTNSESPEHLGNFDVRVIPGGGSSKHGNDQIKPDFVLPDGGETVHLDVFPGNGVHPPVVRSTEYVTYKSVIHIAVFARYQKPEGEQLIKDVGYLHAATGEDFHLIFAGYSQTKPVVSERGALSVPKEIALPGETWFYDDYEFFKQVRMVEGATTWKYAGGLQLLICDVEIADDQPANISQMFVEKKAALENVILIDVEEIKENKLFADFDRFFEALRTIIHNIQSGPNSSSSPTFQLSDHLGLKKGIVVTKRALAKAFKLEFFEAIDEAITLNSFAVKDIRMTPTSN
ncbi:MAG: hypothetical protein Q7T21_01260 [Gallionella sp.]|nr:hypothetical protein [Gallionella sp.]